jgi:hypothetical protein
MDKGGLESIEKRDQKARDYLPAWVRGQRLQVPPAGHCDINALAWSIEKDNGMYHKVAAIPEWRLGDFLKGEEIRGHTSLLRLPPGRKVKLRLDDKYVCKYGKQRNRQMRERGGDQHHWDSAVSAGKLDRSALGLTCKLGCIYHFQVKGYECLPDIVYIKFTLGRELPSGPSQSTMHHLIADGVPLHADRSDHVGHSADVLALVDSQLKAGCPVRMVQAGMHRYGEFIIEIFNVAYSSIVMALSLFF